MGLMPFTAPAIGTPLVLVSDTSTGTYPTLQNGDFGVMLEVLSYGNAYSSAAAVPDLANLPGWTVLTNVQIGTSFQGPGQNAERRYGGARSRVSIRSLTASQSGTSIGSNAAARRLLVFRHPRLVSLVGPTVKVAETTDSYSGPLNYIGQPSPILPVFAVCKARRLSAGSGGTALDTQNYPSITFDGLAPATYGVATTGCIAMVGLLTGPQSTRSIAAALDAASASATSHAAINIRPAA